MDWNCGQFMWFPLQKTSSVKSTEDNHLPVKIVRISQGNINVMVKNTETGKDKKKKKKALQLLSIALRLKDGQTIHRKA